MLRGYRLLELSRGPQTLELQQRYFKDLSGELDQHMRSLRVKGQNVLVLW